MADTRREEIIESTAADRMLDRVSPIYDNAYFALWLFEILGREWDGVWRIIDQLPLQLFPDTVTWAISLWERRYGLTPLTGDTLEIRRQRIQQMRALPHPFIPYTLEQYIQVKTGRLTEVTENISSYTFGVNAITPDIVDGGTIAEFPIDEIARYINRYKQSHLSYILALCSVETISITLTTEYHVFGSNYCGSFYCGEQAAL